jgi:hypothetical protein
MEIIVQQKSGCTGTGVVSRRTFKLKNGFYENSTYNDGGVPTHYIIVAWMQEPPTLRYSGRSKEVQDYMDKFYPNFSDGQYFIVLGDTNDEDPYFELGKSPENFYHHLQEMAIKLAGEKGLLPEYTILDVFENQYNVTLYGEPTNG